MMYNWKRTPFRREISLMYKTEEEHSKVFNFYVNHRYKFYMGCKKIFLGGIYIGNTSQSYVLTWQAHFNKYKHLYYGIYKFKNSIFRKLNKLTFHTSTGPFSYIWQKFMVILKI